MAQEQIRRRKRRRRKGSKGGGGGGRERERCFVVWALSQCMAGGWGERMSVAAGG